MMKLKHLFSNKDLAKMIIKRWNYDLEDKNFLEFYRISSNAIYPFKEGGHLNFLRFSPEAEKTKDSILGELEFLRYLKVNGLPAVVTVKSKDNNELEVCNTPWGRYYAVVFKGVPGKELSDLELTNNIIYKWGKSLGEIHRLSSDFKPCEYRRDSWSEKLEWIEATLKEEADQEIAINEVAILREFFSSLPQSKQNYGLNHYDFECDNVFYHRETDTLYPIDFDDAVYHWFIMDIVQSLNSMMDELPVNRYEEAKDAFISGYRSEHLLDDEMLELAPFFNRYGNLYGYVRCLRSVKEKWDNQPEWIMSLREHIDNRMIRLSKDFGNNIK